MSLTKPRKGGHPKKYWVNKEHTCNGPSGDTSKRVESGRWRWRVWIPDKAQLLSYGWLLAGCWPRGCIIMCTTYNLYLPQTPDPMLLPHEPVNGLIAPLSAKRWEEQCHSLKKSPSENKFPHSNTLIMRMTTQFIFARFAEKLSSPP